MDQSESEETRKYRLALESLTPGGSEYYKNPEQCVEFVKTIRQDQHKKIIEEVKCRKELEERVWELTSQLNEWKRYSGKVDVLNRDNKLLLDSLDQMRLDVIGQID